MIPAKKVAFVEYEDELKAGIAMSSNYAKIISNSKA